MSVKASEISDLIKSRIENFKSASDARNVRELLLALDQQLGTAAGGDRPKTR